MKRLVIILAVLVFGLPVTIHSYQLYSTGRGKIVMLAGKGSEGSVREEILARARDNAEAKAEAEADKKQEAAANDSKEQNDNSNGSDEAVKAPADPNGVTDPNDTDEGKSAEKGDEAEVEEVDDGTVAINLNNIEMKKILDKLAAWTGKVIIPSDEAMKIKITIYAANKVPKEEALSLIFDALRAKGIIAEISENKLFLKPIAEAKLGYVPILTADEPLARISDRSQLVEKYFKLKNTSPSKLINVITPLTASYGHVTAFESSRSIAVIDTVENLIRIEQTIAQFDMPESDKVHEEVFEIKNGDPGEIVQVLQLILAQSKGSKPRPRPSSAAKEAIQPATSVVIEAGTIPITLLPIPKQNWIIARASAEDMERIKVWIAKLDIGESTPTEKTIISVQYIDPLDVVRLVRNTIQNIPGSKLQASIVIEAMRNSKQIVVFGSAENRKLVEMLIAEIDLPEEDLFKTEVFHLKHSDPDQIKENIEGLYEQSAGRFQDYNRGRYQSSTIAPEDVVRVISFPTLKQVTIIASEENLIKITGQIAEWDVPLDLKANQYRLVTLKNSDPKLLVELLSTLFSSEAENPMQNLFRYIFRGGGDDESKKKIVGSLYGLLTFKEVPGTKKILIISKVPEAYDVIEQLIHDLDSQEPGEIPKIVTLNYADAEELSDQLNAILNERGTTATIRRRQQGLSLTGDGSSDDSTSSQSTSQQNSNAEEIRPWWNQGRDDNTQMPTSNLIGKVRFIPVHRSKAILVLSPPEYISAIEEMISTLDKPGKQVMIEAVILEVDHASMTSLGVQLASNPAAFGSLGANAISALSQIAFNQSTSPFVSGDTNLNQGFTTNLNINVLVDLLQKTVDAKVLNQPNLWTKDNEEAVFFKGRQISLETSSSTDSTGNRDTTLFEPERVGVTLGVRPNITPERDVDITINLEISDLANETVNNQPVINKLNTTTNLIVRDGETIMLGGILFQTESGINKKVPLLGDIPIIGALFNHDETVLRNNELLVFITPHVVDGDSSNGKDYMEESRIRMETIRQSLDRVLNTGIMDTKSK